MTAYCFRFHASDECVIGEEFHSFFDDDAAIERAQTLLSKHAMVSVWRDKRFVTRIRRPEPSERPVSSQDL